jgi:hypothetical protein
VLLHATISRRIFDHPEGSDGPAAADQPSTSLYVPALAVTFPVYPDGPVTLRVPVARVPSGGHDAILSVTYMACSGRTCLPPVVDKRIAVSLPIGYLRASAPPN